MSDLDLNRELGSIWRDLLRDVSRVTERAATRLDGLLDEEPDAPAIRSLWAKKILRLEALGHELGMTTKEISSAVGLDDEPNAEKVLAQLAKGGNAELVPDTSPKRWRLTLDQRRSRILLASRLVPEGRWTTYGDMGIAVYGHLRGARAVSRVAAKDPAFANPHRVLAQDGTIPGGWKDDEGQGPEECARRLAREGLELHDGRVPKEKRMYHEELEERLEAAEADRDAF